MSKILSSSRKSPGLTDEPGRCAVRLREQRLSKERFQEGGTTWRVVRSLLKQQGWGFPGGEVVENPPANAGDVGSSPGLGRSHMPRSN